MVSGVAIGAESKWYFCDPAPPIPPAPYTPTFALPTVAMAVFASGGWDRAASCCNGRAPTSCSTLIFQTR